FRLLDVRPHDHVLDVGSGSGGPALFLAQETGCQVTGIDLNEVGIRTGEALAEGAGLTARLRFRRADLKFPLPFHNEEFDAIVCTDVICHVGDRRRVLEEWMRVLRPGGRMLYTDPTVVTGLISQEEFAVRSSTGL